MVRELTKNKTILVIEDEETTLQALTDIFAGEGFDILKAKDGPEGLELALRKHPDLILLDIILPKMTGISMLKKLRADDWGKNAKVIILTNLNEIGTMATALENGVYDFLIKTDWKLRDLVKRVKETLQCCP